MASHGIRDKVAIVGMGCTPFGEHWDKSAEDLLVDAATEAFTTSGIKKADVDAYWLGTMGSGISGLTLSRPLKIDYKPVTRLENMCATGSGAFRNAARRRGSDRRAMAIGVEKLKDSASPASRGPRPQRRHAPPR
jgi:acetyl-CoA C-acetyltransferase